MVGAESALLDRFYQEFWIFLVLLICLVGITICLVGFYCIKYKKGTVKFKVSVAIAIVVLVVFAIFFGMFFSRYCRDYEYLKTSHPIYAQGKMIGFANTTSHDDLTITRSWPTFLITETNEEISLSIIRSEEKVYIGEYYTVVYLPNTYIAELIPQG